MTQWKLPPKIKVYEALGALGDKRVHIDGNTAKVYSSSGNKYYDIAYDPETGAIMANDNGSYWQGYLGYPSIAFLMMKGTLPRSETAERALAGIPWKDINTLYKNDWTKTFAFVDDWIRKHNVDPETIRTDVDGVYAALGQKLFSLLGKRTQPPRGY